MKCTWEKSDFKETKFYKIKALTGGEDKANSVISGHTRQLSQSKPFFVFFPPSCWGIAVCTLVISTKRNHLDMSLVWSGSDILFDTHARWCTVKLVLWMRPILCVPLWDQTQIFISAFGQGHRLDVEPWNTCEEFHANTRRTCILPPRNWVGGALLGGTLLTWRHCGVQPVCPGCDTWSWFINQRMQRGRGRKKKRKGSR